MNPSEGRVPVSWNECADWLDAGGVVLLVHDDGATVPAATTAAEFRIPDFLKWAEFDYFRLLPPPGLVAAPEGMDGGGWLGEAGSVPAGWEWRSALLNPWRVDGNKKISDRVVQCRPPAPKREPEWVPLTKLVGRTIWGETVKVRLAQVGVGPRGCWMRPDLTWTSFPDGTLDLDTGRVRVYAEGDEK